MHLLVVSSGNRHLLVHLPLHNLISMLLKVRLSRDSITWLSLIQLAELGMADDIVVGISAENGLRLDLFNGLLVSFHPGEVVSESGDASDRLYKTGDDTHGNGL